MGYFNLRFKDMSGEMKITEPGHMAVKTVKSFEPDLLKLFILKFKFVILIFNYMDSKLNVVFMKG